MNEALIEAVAREVQRRQREALPAALLIGRAPEEALPWRWVTEGEFSAVVIGSLDAHALLHFPDPLCTQALLEGKAVWLWPGGLDYRRHSATANRALWSRLLAAERQMKQLGVQLLRPARTQLLTAAEVRRRLEAGQEIRGRMTPLARDVLEGRA